jgi:hypothetical protein
VVVQPVQVARGAAIGVAAQDRGPKVGQPAPTGGHGKGS